MARKTIAQVIREEGKLEGRREAEVETLRRLLVRQLKVAFGELPDATRQTIEATAAIDKLEGWLERVILVESLKR